MSHVDVSYAQPLAQKAPWIDFTQSALRFAGYSLPAIESMLGSTPFYAYDRQLLQQRLKQLTQLLDSRVQVHYALKANPMPAVVDWMARHVSGLDVASQQELCLALNSGMCASQISFAGPGKRLAELEAAVQAGCVINLESMQQFTQVCDLASRFGCKPLVALRINPDFQLKNAGMKMTGQASAFGMDTEEAAALLRAWPDALQFVGLHFFAGSQNLSATAINECHAKSLDCALALLQEVNLTPEWINIGGGLGVPYFAHEQPLDLALVAAHVNQLQQKLTARYANTHLVLELGRYLVAEAGIYVCKVVDIKCSKGETFVVCDGGLHHHLAASGNFGQVIRKNYPVLIGNRLAAHDVQCMNIVGPLCTPLDKIAEKVMLPAVALGDYVVVLQSGAYGLSASPIGFLSQPMAKEILLGHCAVHVQKRDC